MRAFLISISCLFMLVVLNFIGKFFIDILEIKNWDFFGSSLLFGFISIIIISLIVSILLHILSLFKKEVKNENI